MSENTQVAQVKKDISAQVLQKVQSFQEAGELTIPKDYIPSNALKSAYIILSETKNREGKLALEHCTQASIAEALLKMVIWGLSPLKKQCYFIMYGNRLECTPDYSGNIALAKRYGGLKNIKAQAIFKGDEFQFEVDGATGRKKIVKHSQTLENLGSTDVIGAYAVIEMDNGVNDVEIMNIKQIQSSWQQGATNGASPAHKKFPDQMAIKTVINRACKLIIRSSDDSALIESEEDEASKLSPVESEVKQSVEQNANSQPLDFEEAQVIDENNIVDVSSGAEQPQSEMFPDEAPFKD
ncbi:RecT family recombinase [Chishuiella changwenlii]|uniref:recombinase RecT n=1 Tax=Chishuiella changwenlii TaxID=1434701 RepID=UPI002FDB1259